MKIRKTFILIILLTLLVFLSSFLINICIYENSKNPFPSFNGQLHVKGSKIYNQYNKIFQLQGLSSHGLQWYSNIINYDNLKYLRDNWGINVFRLALYTEENGYISNPSLKDKLLELSNIIIDLDMYVIIDWHILSDGDPMTHIDKAKDFFNEISSKYSDCPNIIYEICNEPNNVTWENSIKPYANEIIPIIRKNSPNSLIIVGTPNWSTDIDKIIDSPLDYENILYAFHFYAGTHKTAARNKLQDALDANLPVIVSEWGTTNLTGDNEVSLDSSTEWLNFLNQNDISWINWSFSNKDEDSAILNPVDIKSPSEIDSNLTASGKFVKEHISLKAKYKKTK
ncbi:MAG: glycoside hydrolase family 5 protein [Clostridia bacterium]|nr:glycoside hydrolase family 5 protein [Clostridia bacterium]